MNLLTQTRSTEDLQVARDLSAAINCHLVIAELLVKRGITNFDQAKDFFRPDLSQLHDPFLMKNMDLAVDRIALAQRNKERILIFGDYDVDGTTAVAQMVLALRAWQFDIEFYIPDRYTEGYGVSLQGIDYALDQNCSVFIALDCGTKAIDKIRYARERGLDVIVCDHHKPGDVLPDAILLNHKQDDCAYPYKELTGCGIGFKLLQALSSKLNLDAQVYWDLLDLNALSIGADIVPVTGENRILAFHGIKQINERPLRTGLRALLEQAKKSRPLTLNNVVFIIAPRINAAGRMESGKTAVELLISQNLDKARQVAEAIEEFNTNRRELDQEITQEILENLEFDEAFQSQSSTVVYGETWKKGVIGIVASRLIERYYRPTIVLTKSDEEHAVGSVRSVHHFDVHDALVSCEAHLVQFGGHAYAAGLTVRIDQIDAFKAAFENYVATTISEAQREEPLEIELEINLEDLFELGEGISPIPRLMRVLKQLEPHGPGNMRPVFMVKSCFLNPERTKIVGENHLKTEMYVPNQLFGISAIAFNLGDKLDLALSGSAVDLAFVLEENFFQDRSSLQAQIRSITES
jgi:single-stranded-DNA-specific exonuclease